MPDGNSGFSMLLGGFFENDMFIGEGKFALFWSCTPADEKNIWCLTANTETQDAGMSEMSEMDKAGAKSVRYIKE